MTDDRQYRYRSQTGTGTWRDSIEEAKRAAAKAGHGSIDADGRAWLDVFTKIEARARP